MASVKTWDFFNLNVQGGLVEGRFLNAAFTLLAAGAPRLAATSIATTGVVDELPDIAWPIGVVQSFNLGQTSQVMRIWEIGSERSYFIRGRTMGNLGLGRIMYHGPSILRGLYAYLQGEYADGNSFEQLFTNYANAELNTSGQADSKKQYAHAPGYKNLWLDLASDVFSQPIGLLLMFRDSNKSTVGAFYLEYCNVTNHGLATDAGGTIITENAALLYERMVPINVQAVELIKDADSIIGSVTTSKAIGSAASA